jgi:hypothetical protein
MEANILAMGGMALIGAVTGVWGLVTAWEAKRKPPEPEPPPPPRELDFSLPALNTVNNFQMAVNELAKIPEQMKAILDIVPPVQHIEVGQPPWLDAIHEEMTLTGRRISQAAKALQNPPEAFTDMIREMERIGERMQELMEKEPPPQQVTFTELEKKLEKVAQQLSRLAMPYAKPDGDQPGPRRPRTLARADDAIQLHITNTISLQEDLIYELIPPETEIYALNIFNKGPGELTIRFDEEPYFDDPKSATIPPTSGFNGLPVPKMIYALADAGGATLSIYLGHAR